MRLALLPIVLLSGQLLADDFPRTFQAEVISVSDGDTVRVKESDGTIHRLRFNAIDAPESDQPYGPEATQFLENMVLGKTITIKAEGEDQYGRLISVLEVEGQNVNEALLKAGLAWWFYHYSDDLDLASLESEAKAMRKGLFASESPLYPRNWRRGARLETNGSTGGSLETDSAVVILALLPNPSGSDTGNEKVILGNQSTSSQSLEGWSLADDDDGSYSLDGMTIEPGGSLTVTLDDNLLLGNSGDTVSLNGPGGTEVQIISYGSAEKW